MLAVERGAFVHLCTPEGGRGLLNPIVPELNRIRMLLQQASPQQIIQSKGCLFDATARTFTCSRWGRLRYTQTSINRKPQPKQLRYKEPVCGVKKKWNKVNDRTARGRFTSDAGISMCCCCRQFSASSSIKHWPGRREMFASGSDGLV